MNKKPKTVLYRRRKEQKTDYKRRLAQLKSDQQRLVIRYTNQRIITQVVEFNPTGDKVLAAVDSFALKPLGWKYSCKNLPASYLTGLLIAKVAVAVGCKDVILDAGMKSPQKKGKTYAFLKGAVEGGLSIPYGDESIFPDNSRLTGEHITKYLKSLNQEADVAKNLAEVKKKIK